MVDYFDDNVQRFLESGGGEGRRFGYTDALGFCHWCDDYS
jgi:hypothetical protein